MVDVSIPVATPLAATIALANQLPLDRNRSWARWTLVGVNLMVASIWLLVLVAGFKLGVQIPWAAADSIALAGAAMMIVSLIFYARNNARARRDEAR